MGKTPMGSPPTWLSSELGSSLVLAAMITGRAAEAADLIADSLAADPSWWSTTASPGDVAVRLRAAMVETVVAGQPPVGSGDELSQLDPVTLAVVVLRDGEHLPTAEIFSTIDRPARRIQRALVDPRAGAYDSELAQRRGAAPIVGDVLARYPGAAQHVR